MLVLDSMQHRSKRLLGQIIETFPDSKGRIRALLVTTKHGTVKRSIAKLCTVGDRKDSDPPIPSFLTQNDSLYLHSVDQI